VTANAGAGKTAVLVQRFLDILLKTETRLTEIVAITFTEKAAGDLRTRVTRAFEERVDRCTDTQELRRLEHLRDNLASAMIGTIHSFCAQLLREYPVEANVDAGFTVLEGIDRQFLEAEALRGTFEAIMADAASETEREEFLTLVRMFGRSQVESYLFVLLKKREDSERLLRGMLASDRGDDEILNEWHDLRSRELIATLNTPDWRSALVAILRAADGKLAAEVRTLAATWKSHLSPDEKIRLYAEISDLCFTKESKLQKKFIGSAADTPGLRAPSEVLCGHHLSIRELLAAALDPQSRQADAILLRVSRTFMKLYEKCAQIYGSRKEEYGQMDFDDLQLKTVELLRQPDVRRALSAQYRYVMVDEFQDTNHAQYEILNLLFAEFSEGNIFIVGDPKQSIYGFRNADVEIFQRARLQIAEKKAPLIPAAETNAPTAERGGRGAVTLPESFRLLSNLVAFINKVFAPLMRARDGFYEVDYDDLVRGRQNDARGDVELLLVSGSKNADEENEETDSDRKEDAVAAECTMIAHRLKALHGSRHGIFSARDSTEAAAPFEFRDAAILLRNRTHVRALEKALLGQQIPYVVAGGIGYYQTQEILDFCNYFKFLLNSNDDVALAGILRSPFFSISDVDLFQTSLAQRRASFWEKFMTYSDGPGASPQAIRAARILSGDLREANRLPIPLLVRRIFRQTGWVGTVAGLAYGKQNRANIGKLLHIAREFEGKGHVVLFDFVERLLTLIAEEEREGQASLATGENAVRVMTIHAAKGLEFPVVFVPFAHRRFRYDEQPFVDPRVGLGFNVRDPANFDKALSPPMGNYLRQRSRRRTEAEEKRVFYVACTRARDMLVISGKWDGAGSFPSWLNWLAKSLRLDETSISSQLLMFPTKLRFLKADLDGYEIQEESFDLQIGVKKETAVERAAIDSGISSAAADEPVEISIEPLAGRHAGEFFSATHIKTYLECPSKYYLKYQLGLPEQYGVPFDYDENEDANDRLRGELEGSLTHAALQRIERSDISEDDISAVIQSVVRGTTEGSGIEEEEMMEPLLRNVTSFVSSSFGRQALAATEAMAEFTLSSSFGDDYLTGTIDRLYRGTDGRWNILDYKTDRVRADQLQAYSRIYEPQMAFYALLVSKYYRQPEVRASLVFLRFPASPIHHDFTSADLKQFEGSVSEVIGKIRRGDFSRNVQECARCTYRGVDGCFLSQSTLLGGR